MKRQNRKTGLLLALLLAVSMILSACSETDITESQSSVSGGSAESQSADESTIAELQAQIAELQAEKAKAPAEDQLEYTTRIQTAENSQKKSEYEYKSQQVQICCKESGTPAGTDCGDGRGAGDTDGGSS